MTLLNLRQKYFAELSSQFPKQEIFSLFDLTIEWMLGLSKIEIHQSLHKSIPLNDEKKILSTLQRLSSSEPLQYIIGQTAFYGLQIEVNSSVLIPRPETEYLVELILQNPKAGENIKLMDLCSGSGCIAVALAKHLPEASVYGLEFSSDAIEVAEKNALKNAVNINFELDDLLNPSKNYFEFDLIVSNPPYIRESEKKLMHKNVLGYEPDMALFVPDTDSLKFYSAIANFADEYLKADGQIYLEINEALGKECHNLFKKSGYKNVRILKDLEDKDRYLHATK